MTDDTAIQPGTPNGELTIADITAMAGPEFASWLCALFGGIDAGTGSAAHDAPM